MKRYAVIVSAFLFLTGHSYSFAQSLPTMELASIVENPNPRYWKGKGRDGDTSYVVVKAGKLKARWTVPAWWGEGLRPTAGTRYVFEVLYKDVITKPAIFYANSGLGRYLGPSELHRFGGANDGKWKTANIPVSWDLICKRPGEDVTVLCIASPGGELPVSRVKTREAVPADRDAYFSEVRAWVARSDAARMPGFKMKPSLPPVIPASMSKSAIVPFARSYMLPILPISTPQKGEAGAELKILTTQEEFEPATFGVYAQGQDLSAVQVTVGELKGPTGVLAGELEVRVAEYNPMIIGRKKNKKEAYNATRLWPAHPVDIAKGASHWFWITLKTDPKRSRPGTYKGRVEITSGEHRASLPLSVEVLNVKLLTMDEAKVPSGGCLVSLPPEQQLISMRDHNHRAAHLWYFGTRPPMSMKNGKLHLDFTYLDDWMAKAVANGFTDVMWFLGGDPYLYPDNLLLEKDLYNLVKKSRNSRKEFSSKHKGYARNPQSAKVLPEIRELYKEWFRLIAAHAKEKKWPRLIMHPFDEPTKWDRRKKNESKYPIIGSGKWIRYHFSDACKLIREATKDVVTGGDLHHAKPSLVYLKDLDVFCTNAIHEDKELGNKVRAAGVEFWQYKGVNAQQAPHLPRFAFGFYFAAYDSRGGLNWAFNWGGWDYGRGGYIHSWYTPYGEIPAPAHEGFREGLDDRRLVETYKKVFKDDARRMAILKAILKEAPSSRAKGGTDTVNDFWAAVDDLGKLAKWREQLLRELAKR